MASHHLTPSYTHPPLGSQVAITTPGAASHYLALVDSDLGRYFYAGGHRFHVSDDGHGRPDGAGNVVGFRVVCLPQVPSLNP